MPACDLCTFSCMASLGTVSPLHQVLGWHAGKALLAFWLAKELATLVPLSGASMALKADLRKRLPRLVAEALSIAWLTGAHWLAQAALNLPLSTVKVLVAYGPLRAHLWVSLRLGASAV